MLEAARQGGDGRQMPVALNHTLRKFLTNKRSEETIDDQVEIIWATLCTRVAEYVYTGLVPNDDFTMALIATYLAQLSDDFGIASIENAIRGAIIKGLNENASLDKSHYGVYVKCLQSSIVFPTTNGTIPTYVDVWLDV